MSPAFDDNRSVWWTEAGPAEPLPAWQGDARADVVILGAGFTGLSTAWHLLQRFPSRRVVVLEARRVGGGASGRNGGQVLNWVNGLDTAEPEPTQQIWDFTHGAIDALFALVREQGLQVSMSRRGALEVFTSAAQAEHAHAKAERLRGWGIPVEFLQGAALDRRLRLSGAVGALYDPTAGRVNGVELCRELTRLVRARGGEVYEDSEALRVVEGPEVEVQTARGALRAGAVVLATSAWTARLGYFTRGFIPLHSHVVSTAPLDAEQREALGLGELDGFSDDMDRIAYGALSGGGRLVFGGGSNAAYGYQYGGTTTWAGSPEPGLAAVQRRLREALPGAAGVALDHRWAGPLCITLSRVCAMGVMGAHRNVYYSLGYSGHGVTLANAAGRVLADLYAGEGERWAHLPFVNRRPGGIPPEPLRWLGYQGFTRLTGRSPRRPE